MYSLNIATIAKQIQELIKKNKLIASAISALGTYSTDEVDTGKIWIDDGEIYRKVTTGLSITIATTTTTWVDTGIADTGIDTILNCFGLDSSGEYFPLQMAKLSGSHTLGIYTAVHANRAFTTLVFEYTKAAALAKTPDETPDEKLNIEETPEEAPQEVKKTTRKKS